MDSGWMGCAEVVKGSSISNVNSCTEIELFPFRVGDCKICFLTNCIYTSVYIKFIAWLQDFIHAS